MTIGILNNEWNSQLSIICDQLWMFRLVTVNYANVIYCSTVVLSEYEKGKRTTFIHAKVIITFIVGLRYHIMTKRQRYCRYTVSIKSFCPHTYRYTLCLFWDVVKICIHNYCWKFHPSSTVGRISKIDQHLPKSCQNQMSPSCGTQRTRTVNCLRSKQFILFLPRFSDMKNRRYMWYNCISTKIKFQC